MDGEPRRRGSITGALFLIALGVFFLLVNMLPNFDPWLTMMRYWPVVLILLGLGKIWDSYRLRHNPGMANGGSSGTTIALLLFLGFIALALWGGRGSAATNHEAESVDLKGATSVDASIEMPAGTLDVSGGASKLLDANFNYRESEGRPSVDYAVTDGKGQLDVTQSNERHIHLGGRQNDWKLRFADDVPLDLKLNFGAGKSDLNLRGMNVGNLEINMGVGRMDLNLTGERKRDLEVDIQGGVGSARIVLPKDVGVEAYASGGIGSVDAHGMKRDGDAYVNDAYGKNGAKIRLNIKGGIGGIELVQER